MPISKDDIFAGIDGTGTDDNEAYKKEFANSFVNQHARSWPNPNRYYHRGPTLLGSETGNYAKEAANFVKNLYEGAQKKKADARIFLSGYSRGGAAVVHTAQLLAQDKIPVHGLLLYDAVSRTNTVGDVSAIPGNVQNAFHAVRSAQACSREEFGNCARKGGQSYQEQTFFCTHGGMGGTPWPRGEHQPTDFISESDTRAASAVAAAGWVAGGIPGAVQHYSEYDDYSSTKVTYAMDAAVSKQVGRWMHMNLMRII